MSYGTVDGGWERPKRTLGQNFLVDRAAQRKIVAALGAGLEDDVVELGPGRGALTRHLIGKVRHLRLVELDERLAARWRGEHAESNEVTVVEGDMMQRRLHHAFPHPGHVLVIGNIPFYLTSPLIFRLLERPRPKAVVLTVQHEVARRMVAVPGGRAYGALSVGVQTVAECELLFRLPPDSFRPRPKVGSAVVRVTPLRPPPLDEAREHALRVVVRSCFSWRRKQLRRILAAHPEFALGGGRAGAVLEDLRIRPETRPQSLTPADFLRLSAALANVPKRCAREREEDG